MSPPLTPAPLPQVSTDIEDPKVRASLQNILIHLQRTRRTIYDSSAEESLGAQLTSLGDRAKDIYVFDLGGAPSVTPTPPGYAAKPLVNQNAGTIVNCNVWGQSPATGTIIIEVQRQGTPVTVLQVSAGALSAIQDGLDVAVAQYDVLKVVVIEAPDSPGFDDAVVYVQVR